MHNMLSKRNRVACSPLLRKGGAHQKSNSAQRQGRKRHAIQSLNDWREDIAFERSLMKKY